MPEHPNIPRRVVHVRRQEPAQREPQLATPVAPLAASDEPLFVSVAEFARLVGLKRGHAYECVKNGEIASIKLGGRILVPRSAIQALIDSATKGSSDA